VRKRPRRAVIQPVDQHGLPAATVAGDPRLSREGTSMWPDRWFFRAMLVCTPNTD